MRSKFKRYSDMILSLLVLAGALSLGWIGLTKEPTVPASSQPYDSLVSIPEDATVIVIDAGHGGFDGGAVGSKTGVIEADLNLETAELLSKELTARGYYVIMTRSGSDALGETKKDDMQERRRIMQSDDVDYVISIHMNKFKDPTVSGPMVFYMKDSELSKSFAEHVMYSICESLEKQQRSANPEDLFVLRVPRVPSILVECGFLSNAQDEADLQKPEYKEKIVRGIADGLEQFIADSKTGDND